MNIKPLAALLMILLAAALGGCRDRDDHSEPHSGGETHASEGRHDDEHEGEYGHKPEQEHAGRTTIDKQTADEMGIRTAAASSGVIRDTHELQGLLTPVEGRHARVRARFPGPVQEVRAGVGDRVNAGQTLAVIESNISLSPYNVPAPFAGTILDVNVGVGDLAGDDTLFELADLSKLWVDVHLFGADAQHIAPGLPIHITRLSDGIEISTKLDRILPGTATASQSTVARATISNTDGRWRPGTAVRAQVVVSERRADLVAPLTALQTYKGETVVFLQAGDTYTPRKIRLGERDSKNAEVLQGLTGGEMVVVEQSYLIKADLEKESASHAH